MRATTQSTRPSDVTRRTALKGIGATAAAALAPVRLRAQSEHVIVIGAGLSGLYASMLLEEEEVKVTLLEATDRIGGRVITMYDVPGSPEAGLIELGGLYARCLDLCTRLEIPLEPTSVGATFGSLFGDRREGSLIHINGQQVLASDWPTSPLNPFPDADKKLLPHLAQFAYLQPDLAFNAVEDWIDPKFNHLDVPLYDYLKAKGLNEEALRLMDIANNNGGLQNSAVNEMRILYWAQYGGNSGLAEIGPRHIVGGSEVLTKKMAGSLKTEIRLKKIVVQISQTDSGVEVLCSDGSTYKADRVITTMQYCVLRNVAIYPPPPPAQRAAINELPSVPCMTVYLVPEKPFYWEEDDLPYAMFTDTPLGFVGLVRDWKNGEITGVSCNIRSANYPPYSLMSEAEIGPYVLHWFEKVRPASKGKLRVAKVYDKTRIPYEAGCFSYWLPGQVTRFGREMRKPFGRIHLAGDATAVLNRGGEAALESGERAAVEVLMAL